MKRFLLIVTFLVASALAFAQVKIPLEYQHTYFFDSAKTITSDKWQALNPPITLVITETTVTMNDITITISKISFVEAKNLYYIYFSDDAEEYMVYDPDNSILALGFISDGQAHALLHFASEKSSFGNPDQGT